MKGDTDALQLRLMMPTTRPVGCFSVTGCLREVDRRAFDSRASVSVSSGSSSDSSTSSSLSVARGNA